MPWAAAMSSMARIRSTLSFTCRVCNPAVTPMLTWSSTLAEVGMVSALAGWARTLFSVARAAAVYWTIMKPEFSPPCWVRKAGSTWALLASSVRRMIRRSEMLPSSAMAMLR